MSHAVMRTSPKGSPFIGRCTKCGTEGLGIGSPLEDCPADGLVSDEQALVDILDGPEYDRSIHQNPDAAAWAAFFKRTFPESDEGLMLGWFANAMMAMHDHMQNRADLAPALPSADYAAALEAAAARASDLLLNEPQKKRLHIVDRIRALITPAQHDALAAHVAAEVAKARAEDAAKLLAAAGQEYVLEHVMETDWHRQGRHSAVRGMMVRMGLYAELEGAIDAALAQIGAKP